MSASEITEPRRLGVTLDPGLVLERLILRRLSDLKPKRGQDWLRSLLAQGFLAEGQWIRREAPRDGERASSAPIPRFPTTPFASWLQRAPAPAPHALESAPVPVSASPITNVSTDLKPFAHLRKVIG